MRFDDDGLIISEIWPRGDAANIGDSMANTCRFYHLAAIDKEVKTLDAIKALSKFKTQIGYVRHPDVPACWGELDTSSDQCLPFYLAAKHYYPQFAYEMKARIKLSGWKTGNNDFVSPMFLAVLLESKVLLDLALICQLFIFAIPIRWNDGKKSFEFSWGSSCDWLNTVHCAFEAGVIVRLLFPKTIALRKIKEYFAPEPNSEWLVRYYGDAFKLLF